MNKKKKRDLLFMMQIQKTEKGLFNSARQHLEMSSFVIIRVQKMSTNGKRNAKEKKKKYHYDGLRKRVRKYMLVTIFFLFFSLLWIKMQMNRLHVCAI